MSRNRLHCQKSVDLMLVLFLIAIICLVRMLGGFSAATKVVLVMYISKWTRGYM